MTPRLALLAAGIVLASPLHAADIYRWVDDAGRTHLSDVVPEKYKKSAQRIDSKQFDVSAEQRREAEALASQEKARAAQAMQRKTRADAAEAARAAWAGTLGKPRTSGNDSNDCATLQRLYRESQECFAPYRTVNGSTKAEAFEKCTVVVNPEVKCGLAPAD